MRARKRRGALFMYFRQEPSYHAGGRRDLLQHGPCDHDLFKGASKLTQLQRLYYEEPTYTASLSCLKLLTRLELGGGSEGWQESEMWEAEEAFGQLPALRVVSGFSALWQADFPATSLASRLTALQIDCSIIHLRKGWIDLSLSTLDLYVLLPI